MKAKFAIAITILSFTKEAILGLGSTLIAHIASLRHVSLIVRGDLELSCGVELSIDFLAGQTGCNVIPAVSTLLQRRCCERL